MSLEQAARKDDPVSTSGARVGMYTGAGILGAVFGVAGFFTEGGAWAAMGWGVTLGSIAGKFFGQFLPDTPGSAKDIIDGSHDVYTNELPQARVGDPTTKGKITEGSRTVSANLKPAARRGDNTEQGTIERGSPNVWIGGEPAVEVERGENIAWYEELLLAFAGGTLMELKEYKLLEAALRSGEDEAVNLALEKAADVAKASGQEGLAQALEAMKTIRSLKIPEGIKILTPKGE